MKTFYLQLNHLCVEISYPWPLPPAPLQRHWSPWQVKKPKSEISIQIKAIESKNLLDWCRPDIFRRGTSSIYNTYGSYTAILEKEGIFMGQIIFASHLKPEIVYYGVIEPVLHALLRKFDWFQLHGVVVTNPEKAVLILGPSGAGKSTTATIFLLAGYQPLSDDYSLVNLQKGIAKAWGSDNGIYLSPSFIPKLQKLGHLEKGRYRTMGPFLKRQVYSPKYAGSFLEKARSQQIKIVIFPQVKPKTKTKIKKLSPQQALLYFFQQRPAANSCYLKDVESVHRLFDFYRILAGKINCYHLTLGKNLSKMKGIVQGLADTRAF
jgi:hypothetical protein